MSADVPFELDPELLRGKVAVITGASRGLGAGLADRFASYGVDGDDDGERDQCVAREGGEPVGVEIFVVGDRLDQNVILHSETA